MVKVEQIFDFYIYVLKYGHKACCHYDPVFQVYGIEAMSTYEDGADWGIFIELAVGDEWL